jgi:hypothetical protein
MRTYWACNSIAAGDVYVVPSESDVAFRAANYAVLRDGLTVEGGELSVILGSVSGCSP